MLTCIKCDKIIDAYTYENDSHHFLVFCPECARKHAEYWHKRFK